MDHQTARNRALYDTPHRSVSETRTVFDVLLIVWRIGWRVLCSMFQSARLRGMRRSTATDTISESRLSRCQMDLYLPKRPRFAVYRLSLLPFPRSHVGIK